MQADKGVRVRCTSKGTAIKLRQRAYKFRDMERADSEKMYARDDPRWHTSDYDEVTVTIREEEGIWYCFFEKFLNEQALSGIMEEL